MIVTVDRPVSGNRERDRNNGLSMPFSINSRNIWGFARHPLRALAAFLESPVRFPNISDVASSDSSDREALFRYIDGQFDRAQSWRDVEWLAAEWSGSLSVKGWSRPSMR